MRLSGTNLYGKEARPIQSKEATVAVHAVTKAGVETQCALELTVAQLWRLEVYAKAHGKSLAAMLGRLLDFSTLPDQDLEKPAAIGKMDDAAEALKMRIDRN